MRRKLVDIRISCLILSSLCSHHYHFFVKKSRSDIFDSAIRQNKYFSSVLDDVALNTIFPSSRFGQTLNMVATVMKARDSLGHDRQFFFVETGGWDTHSNQFASDDVRFPELNDALSAFVDEMKDQGLWDDVTLMEISDFGKFFCFVLCKMIFGYTN